MLVLNIYLIVLGLINPLLFRPNQSILKSRFAVNLLNDFS